MISWQRSRQQWKTARDFAGFRKKYPDRFFDVGIAEEHAVTFAAGLAAGGIKPVFAVYSSFLQRAYDQMIHDVALQNLPVMFAVDRAGLVGNDGETHQGIFDLSYLSTIPNMVVLSPKHKWELADMIRFGIAYDGPVAIRYPRGSACDACPEFRSPVVYGKSEMLYEEREIAVIFVGHMFGEALEVRKQLKESRISLHTGQCKICKTTGYRDAGSPDRAAQADRYDRRKCKIRRIR
mgnify:FL=1